MALMNYNNNNFTQVITQRMTDLTDNMKLPEFQKGFRRNQSCLDNIFSSNGMAQIRLSANEGKLLVLFYDFRNAQ